MVDVPEGTPSIVMRFTFTSSPKVQWSVKPPVIISRSILSNREFDDSGDSLNPAHFLVSFARAHVNNHLHLHTSIRRLSCFGKDDCLVAQNEANEVRRFHSFHRPGTFSSRIPERMLWWDVLVMTDSILVPALQWSHDCLTFTRQSGDYRVQMVGNCLHWRVVSELKGPIHNWIVPFKSFHH